MVVLAGTVAMKDPVLKGVDMHRMDAGSWFEVMEFVGGVQWSPTIGSKVGGGRSGCTQNLTEHEDGSLWEQFVDVDDSGARVF